MAIFKLKKKKKKTTKNAMFFVLNFFNLMNKKCTFVIKHQENENKISFLTNL